MNISSKTIIAGTLLCAELTQTQARKNSHHENGPPPHPLFSDIDINNNGYIDFDEFSTQKAPKKGDQNFFSKMDKDDNDMISKAEFMNHKPPKKRKEIMSKSMNSAISMSPPPQRTDQNLTSVNNQ